METLGLLSGNGVFKQGIWGIHGCADDDDFLNIFRRE